MARQPLSLLVLALMGCPNPNEWEGTFDIPEALDIVPVSDANPFHEPIGYAASLHGGRVAIMSLREGRYLADSPTASFVRAAPLAAGNARVLGSIAAVAAGDGTLTVYAADRAFSTLVRLPHVVAVADDGTPERAPTTITQPGFVDADGSGDAPRMTELRAMTGFATTEDWTIEFDGTEWSAVGSRSGRTEARAETDVEFYDTEGGLSFTVTGAATSGDSFTFSTDNGSTEINVGGVPLHLATSPDQSSIAMILSRADDPAALVWLDPMTGQVDKDVVLPADATPVRMTWSSDGRLFVADGSRSSFWEIVPGEDDTVIEHLLPWPVSDIAPLLGAESNTVTVAPLIGTSVWVYDLDEGALRDLNTLEEGVNGLEMYSLVRGLGSIEQAFLWPEVNDNQVGLRGRAVAISLHRGAMVFLGEDTGCLIRDGLGPRTGASTTAGTGLDYSFAPGNITGGPELQPNGTNNRSVVVNRCGGVATSETWNLRYDANQSGWIVEGSVSGVQDALAFEDRRYITNNGAVSFVIQSGVRPSEDGWQFQFTVNSGLLGVTGDSTGDGTRNVSFSLPGDPMAYREIKTITDDVWQPVIDQPYVVVPVSGSDLVAKIDPLTGFVEVAFW
ncbi:MAG: hypothetical protein ACJATT_000554 [Myxococcota bacterium]|jgi:hypothetical protein